MGLGKRVHNILLTINRLSLRVSGLGLGFRVKVILLTTIKLSRRALGFRDKGLHTLGKRVYIYATYYHRAFYKGFRV